MLKLFIETENAAFDDEPATELARILRELADDLEESGGFGYARLRDVNGHPVGECQITQPEKD